MLAVDLITYQQQQKQDASFSLSHLCNRQVCKTAAKQKRIIIILIKSNMDNQIASQG